METVTDWILSAGSAALMIVVTSSWLTSIRARKSEQSVSSDWFALPAWAQIALGIAAIAAFIWLGFLFWIPLPLSLSDAITATLRVIGLTIYLAGLFLTLWARWALGRMYGVSTGSSAPLQAGHQLIQRGPYAIIRHPMYLGYWLVMLGVLLTYRTWTSLALLAMTVPSFRRRAGREESALAASFGKEWQAYATRVPMFIPNWKIKSRKNNP
ncbi:MAG TPA: isoprenylcysteine carboxylmethyltransferase family protein [Anaerolineales bacterium]|nr:isoprenylcysteine carboxylmethyltransferase family protein [Anaerolineales bacterium]